MSRLLLWEARERPAGLHPPPGFLTLRASALRRAWCWQLPKDGWVSSVQGAENLPATEETSLEQAAETTHTAIPTRAPNAAQAHDGNDSAQLEGGATQAALTRAVPEKSVRAPAASHHTQCPQQAGPQTHS